MGARSIVMGVLTRSGGGENRQLDYVVLGAWPRRRCCQGLRKSIDTAVTAFDVVGWTREGPNDRYFLFQGHLLELEMACGTKNANEQLQEVREVCR